MTLQEIEKLFENAPEGATHWMPESCEWLEGFWKRVGTANYFYEKGKWEFSGGKPFGHLNLVERPSPSPAWSGEGLPPAGCKVEYLTYGNEWKSGTYVGQFNGQMVCGCDDSGVVGIVGSGQMRPVRTPKQIAADEREAAIAVACADISSTIQALAGYVPNDAAAVKTVRAMIEAGYRKQVAK